ncbi:MAG TPA: serine/threonine-protein kinase, partial [Pirellulaceae bacterium]|nr:serine/threonine-protein kinase [Pirellulaceae bacterium]
MAGKKLRIGDEPVPGYRLVDFLGRGGFGEVWKAVGPGGIEVALKVIDSLAPRQGGKELRALRLLKRIRHPNLVPLIAYWLKDARGELLPDDSQDDATRGSRAGDGHGPGLSGSRSGGLTGSNSGGGARDSTLGGPSSSFPPTAAQLIIAMGLAEQSLFDRLEQCQAAGLPGIPIDELMTYLDDAARAIDLLNVQHNIQHCDIKPQNILILSGAAQVCDFGLAKAIGDMRQTSMSAGTIAYGPPELFSTQGPCPTTDQYSLAIGYYELRTGRLPFVEETITAVLEAKKTGRLDLSLVSPAEQEVLTKATSPDPADRFPTTLAMVRRLRACFPEIEQLGGASGPLPRSAGSDGSAGSSANPNAPPGSPLVDTVGKSQPPLRGTLNVSDLDTQHTAPTDRRSRSDWHQAADDGTDRASKPTRKPRRQSSPTGPIIVAIVLVAVGIGAWTQRDSIRRWLGGKRPVDGAAASKPVPERTAPDPTTTKAKTEATTPDKGKMSPDDP